jgi:disulfide bond formation protein DsbB
MRKWLLLAALMAFLSLALVACGGGGESETPEEPTAVGDAANGQTLFAGTCAGCHGPDAKGLPNLGKDMTTSQFIRDSSDEELLAFVKVGRPASDPANTTGVDMPPRGGNPSLTDEQLQDIIAYIRTLQE